MAPKSKFATIVFSLLPGAGHMYLGRQQKGLMFMLAFFLSIFLASWTNGLLMVGYLIPVIWFYSFFDALQCYDQNSSAENGDLDWQSLFQKQRWLGLGLIAVGILILLNKLAYPVLRLFLSYTEIRTVCISFVALLLIAGGVRLAWGKPLSPAKRPALKAAEGELSLPGEEAAAPVGLSAAVDKPLDDSAQEGE